MVAVPKSKIIKLSLPFCRLIDNIINLIKKETGKSFKLVITGGYSDLFRKSLKTRVIQNKDITIKGLIKIAKLIK